MDHSHLTIEEETIREALLEKPAPCQKFKETSQVASNRTRKVKGNVEHGSEERSKGM